MLNDLGPSSRVSCVTEVASIKNMLPKAMILLAFATFCSGGQPRFVRPCYLKDTKCIASNMAANSRCSAPRGPVPAKYTVKKFRYDTPYFNSSYIDHNLVIRNLDKCSVSEFFYNVETDTAVLCIECPNLNLQSTRTLIKHGSCREDTYYNYNINGTYPLIRFTINLHPANAMDLCNSFTFAEVTQLPVFDINPNDRRTARILTRDLTKLNIYEIETFHYRANSLARYFINRALCNFGCDT